MFSRVVAALRTARTPADLPILSRALSQSLRPGPNLAVILANAAPPQSREPLQDAIAYLNTAYRTVASSTVRLLQAGTGRQSRPRRWDYRGRNPLGRPTLAAAGGASKPVSEEDNLFAQVSQRYRTYNAGTQISIGQRSLNAGSSAPSS
jgi:hypothetical protein